MTALQRKGLKVKIQSLKRLSTLPGELRTALKEAGVDTDIRCSTTALLRITAEAALAAAAALEIELDGLL